MLCKSEKNIGKKTKYKHTFTSNSCEAYIRWDNNCWQSAQSIYWINYHFYSLFRLWCWYVIIHKMTFAILLALCIQAIKLCTHRIQPFGCGYFNNIFIFIYQYHFQSYKVHIQMENLMLLLLQNEKNQLKHCQHFSAVRKSILISFYWCV